MEVKMLEATREQACGGSDGVWIYREDYLTSLDLWGAAKKSSYKFNIYIIHVCLFNKIKDIMLLYVFTIKCQ
jgi:hypothetical protein